MSKSMDIRIAEVNARNIMEAVEAGWHMRTNGGVSIKELTTYADTSQSTATRALTCAVQLGMMEQKDSKYITLDKVSIIGKASQDDWSAIFGRHLPNYKPFIMFVALISRGANAEEAARKVAVIYDLTLSPNAVRTTLTNWGIYAGALEKQKDQSLVIKIDTDQLEAEAIRNLLEAMKNDIKARIYLNNKLGEEVYAYLPSEDLDFLVKSIRNYELDARESVDKGMKALESFLRLLCNDKGINSTKCNGIGQLALELRSNSVITSKHVNIGQGLGAIRNAAEHSIDKETNQRWIINPDSAIESILVSLTYIRSVYNYVFENLQEF